MTQNAQPDDYVPPPIKRYSFEIKGGAHDFADLADLLSSLAFDLTAEQVFSRISSRGYILRVIDHGGPTKDEYEERLLAWSDARREARRDT
jgi:hypothetical protein